MTDSKLNDTEKSMVLLKLDEVQTDLQAIKKILHGSDVGNLGILQKVNFMWRIHIVWPLCTMSAVLGAVGTLIMQRLLK